MNADVIIVGGGLAGGLTALRLSQLHPDKKVLLLERESKLGGNHTWSFHESDLRALEASEVEKTDEPELWLKPLISKSWNSHEVRFPKHDRIIENRYHSIRSDHFHKTLTNLLGRSVRLNCDIRRITDFEVETSDGVILRAPLVINASGILPSQQTENTFAGTGCGWIKSLGFDLKLKKPHGLNRPLLVDAKVPQMDGCRYFSYFPWDETRIFIKETFLSASSSLNHQRITRSIKAYAERAGWEIEDVERIEESHMPLPLYALTYDLPSTEAVEFDGEDFTDQSPVCISTGSGWFHSATSDSLPDAVRIADFICGLEQLRTGPVRADLRKFRYDWIDQQRFYRLINRLMFRAAEPSLRYQVLERFYGLKNDVVERYFAGTTSRTDRTKILGYKPIVRPGRATKNWTAETPVTAATSEVATTTTSVDAGASA